MQKDRLRTILNERAEGAGVDVVKRDRLKSRHLRLQLPALEQRVL